MDVHTEVSKLLEQMLDLVPREREKDAERLTDEISTLVMAYSMPAIDNTFDGIRMTPQELRMVELLHAKRGKFVTREALLCAMSYDKHDAPEEKVVDVYIFKLRKKLDGTRFSIENQHGFGYRLLVQEDVAAPVSAAVPSLPTPQRTAGEAFAGIALTRTQMRLASTLFEKLGRTVPEEEIYLSLYGIDHMAWPSTKALDVLIFQLRAKFRGTRFSIETQHSFGYRLVEERLAA